MQAGPGLHVSAEHQLPGVRIQEYQPLHPVEKWIPIPVSLKPVQSPVQALWGSPQSVVRSSQSRLSVFELLQ
jgi:hypothetical protein